jgi:hypothetical protein
VIEKLSRGQPLYVPPDAIAAGILIKVGNGTGAAKGKDGTDEAVIPTKSTSALTPMFYSGGSSE